LVATNVDVRAVNEVTVAYVTVTTPGFATFLVGSNNHVTILGDADDVGPVRSGVGCGLTGSGSRPREIGGGVYTSSSVLAQRRSFCVAPVAVALLQAGAPVMVMELAKGRWVTEADVQSVSFAFDGVGVAGSEGVVNVAASKSDASRCAEGLITTTIATIRRTLAIRRRTLAIRRRTLSGLKHAASGE
jgi:hypothetical protein